MTITNSSIQILKLKDIYINFKEGYANKKIKQESSIKQNQYAYGGTYVLGICSGWGIFGSSELCRSS